MTAPPDAVPVVHLPYARTLLAHPHEVETRVREDNVAETVLHLGDPTKPLDILTIPYAGDWGMVYEMHERMKKRWIKRVGDFEWLPEVHGAMLTDSRWHDPNEKCERCGEPLAEVDASIVCVKCTTALTDSERP